MPRIYPISVPAPDLSNVYRLSASAGRNAGYNEFMSNFIDHQWDLQQDKLRARLKEQERIRKEQAKAREDAAKAAAAEEAASDSGDPDKEGFWSKLGQIGADGLGRTIDVLSRANYAAAEGFNTLMNADDDNKSDEEKTFWEKITPGITGKSPLEVLDDINVGDVGDAVSNAWEGLKGKKKTTFAQVIKEQAAKDGDKNLFDNKIYQGVAGFGADVLADPTTYVGVGLVTKPLKAAKAGREADKLESLASDIEKLGLKHGEEGKEVPLTLPEVKAMLGMRPKNASARRLSRKAQQAENIRVQTQHIDRLKSLLRKDPEVDNSSIAKLDEEITALHKQREAGLTDYQREAYTRKLAELDVDPNLSDKLNIPTPAVTSALKDWERAVGLGTVAKAFKEEGMARRGLKAKSFDEVLGKGWQEDARISPEFRATAFDTASQLARKDVAHTKHVKENIAIGKQIKDLEARKAKIKNDPDYAKEVADIDAQIAARKKVQQLNYNKQDLIKASIFSQITRHHLKSFEGASPELVEEVTNLTARSAEIDELLKRIKQQEDDFGVGGVEISGQSVRTSSDVEAGEGIVFNERNELLREKQQVKQRLRQIENSDEFLAKESVKAPEGLEGEIDEAFLKGKSDNPEVEVFRRDVRNEFNQRYETEREALTQKKLREKRATALDEVVPKHVRDAFGNPALTKTDVAASVGQKFQTPKVEIDGQTIYKTQKDKLTKYVTEQDIAEAIKRSSIKAGTETHKEAMSILDKIKENKRILDDGDIDAIEGRRLENELDGFRNRLEEMQKASKTTISPEHLAFDRIFKEKWGKSVSTMTKAKNTTIKDVRQARTAIEKKQIGLTSAEKAAINAEAKDRAFSSINQNLSNNTLKVSSSRDIEFEVWDEDAFKLAHEGAIQQAKEEYAIKFAEAQGTLKGEALAAKAAELRKIRDTKVALQKEAFEEATKTRRAMEARVDEQVLLNVLEENVKTGRNYMRVSAAGVKLGDIPVPKIMTAATEKIGGLPILQAAHKIWSDAFKPASQIEPELNLARLRAQSNTPRIIKHHVDDIRHRFSRFSPDLRRSTLTAVRKGAPSGNKTLYDQTVKYFDELVPYLSGKISVGNQPLKISEINRYLDDKYKFMDVNSKFVDNLDLTSGAKILKSMRRLPDNSDVMEVMWNLRIATEQALADKNLRHTITSLYGVKRVLRKGDEKVQPPSEAEKIIESLHDEHGWIEVNDLGKDHYFAPEAAAEINKLLEMTKPHKVHEITKLYDKVQRGWKSAVTVYNPGYYTRNGIGETIMGMFDGLYDPSWYMKSGRVLRYAMPDHMEDTLKQLEPWKRHQTQAQKASRPVMKTKYGKKLSAEDVWVLYHDAGLKSGFISSEFDHYFPKGGSLKASPVGQFASKVNDKVRETGEKYEDYFRLSHFMYALNQSGKKNLKEAAEEAATRVRKYHFDYTDFTPFEKTTMMRVFPFYKWTRKAMPLMASMIFTKPGAVMLYPKGMQNLSYATGGTDPATDENGFLPNYEEVTPEWMRNLFSYPMGTDAQDDMTYMNVATPAFDVYKMMQNPTGTALGMTSPLIKTPLEQMIGQTLDPDFNLPVETPQQRLEHLARTTPITSLINNIKKGNEEGKDSAITEAPNRLDEKLTSYLTGLGYYENNKSRQQGEQMRRNGIEE